MHALQRNNLFPRRLSAIKGLDFRTDRPGFRLLGWKEEGREMGVILVKRGMF